MLAPDRRHFLKAAAASLGGMALLDVIDRTSLLAQTEPTVGVRKEVSTLAADGPELKAYRDAITAMRKLSANDVHGWSSQASIHQGFCPHGNWFFLPWHRAYLQYFEAICQKMSGDKSFRLPYWDWTKNPRLPAAFLEGVLKDDTRAVGANDTIDVGVTGKQVMADIMAITDFETFASFRATAQRGGPRRKGPLESGPHDGVHIWISGNMGTFMSPLDPIFWLHHCNIDRIWSEWTESHPGATTADPAWLDFEVHDFVDADKNPVKPKVSTLLDTRKLGYRYDTQRETVVVAPKPPDAERRAAAPAAAAPLRAQQAWKESIQINQAVSTLIKAPAPLAERLKAFAADDKLRETVRLEVQNVMPPKERRVYVRVFVNCPNPTAKTPPTDPTYLGTFTFFGDDHDHAEHAPAGAAAEGGGGTTYVYNAAPLLQRLSKTEYAPDGDYKISLVAVPLGGGDPPQVKIEPKSVNLEAVAPKP